MQEKHSVILVTQGRPEALGSLETQEVAIIRNAQECPPDAKLTQSNTMRTWCA